MEAILDGISTLFYNLVSYITTFFHFITDFFNSLWCNVVFLFTQCQLLLFDALLTIPIWTLNLLAPYLNSLDNTTFPLATYYCSMPPSALYVANKLNIPECLSLLLIAFIYRAKIEVVKMIT